MIKTSQMAWTYLNTVRVVTSTPSTNVSVSVVVELQTTCQRMRKQQTVNGLLRKAVDRESMRDILASSTAEC